MDMPVIPAAPGADVLREEASSLRVRADEGTGQLQTDRGAEMARRSQEHVGDENALKPASAGLGDAHREIVPTPKADIGPMLDPKETQNFAFALLGMSLIGAAAGRGHFDMAMASMDGMLKGMKEGAEENFKARREEFDREFKLAIEKQRQADRVYEDLLKSKKLSLNAVAEQVRIHAAANKDWDMEAKARAKDFQGMYDRMYKNLQAADKLEQQGKTFKLGLDRLEETKRHDKAMEANAAEKKASATQQGEFTEEDVKYWGEVMQKGGSLPPRLATTPGGKWLTQQVMSYMSKGDVKPAEMLANQAEFGGLKAGERTAGTRIANVEMAVNEAKNMAGIVLDTSRKFDRTNFPPINKALKAFQDNTGSTESRNFGAAVNSFINAYARAISPTGVPTVHDKEHAREVLTTSDTQAQVESNMGILQREMEAAQKSPHQTRQGLRESMTGGPGASSPASANAKGWKLHVDAQGNKAYVSPDGKQFEEAK